MEEYGQNVELTEEAQMERNRQRAQKTSEKRAQLERQRVNDAIIAYQKLRPDLQPDDYRTLYPSRFRPIWIGRSLYRPPWNTEGEEVYTLAIDNTFSTPMDKEGVQALIAGLQEMIAE